MESKICDESEAIVVKNLSNLLIKLELTGFKLSGDTFKSFCRFLKHSYLKNLSL